MGMTVRELVYDVGGGCQNGVACKAVQIGGPSGGCLPAELFDTPIEYEALMQAGAIVGSGGMVVVDETTCMVDLARYFLTFTQNESCGKCVPCRIGTKRMLETVTRICEGQGEPEDIDNLEALANDVRATSLCGLGQTAPNPVLTTLRYFRHEYEEHIFESHCRAGACTQLMTFDIVDDVQGMRRVQEALPGLRDHRRTQGSPRHRPRTLREVRRLRIALPVRRDHEVVGSRMQFSTDVQTSEG